MIATDELKATINRLELLAKNTDVPEEQVMVDVIVVNLKHILQQTEVLSQTDDFKNMVKEKMKNDSSES